MFGSFYLKGDQAPGAVFSNQRTQCCALRGRRHFCSGSQQVRDTTVSVFLWLNAMTLVLEHPTASRHVCSVEPDTPLYPRHRRSCGAQVDFLWTLGRGTTCEDTTLQPPGLAASPQRESLGHCPSVLGTASGARGAAGRRAGAHWKPALRVWPFFCQSFLLPTHSSQKRISKNGVIVTSFWIAGLGSCVTGLRKKLQLFFFFF